MATERFLYGTETATSPAIPANGSKLNMGKEEQQVKNFLSTDKEEVSPPEAELPRAPKSLLKESKSTGKPTFTFVDTKPNFGNSKPMTKDSLPSKRAATSTNESSPPGVKEQLTRFRKEPKFSATPELNMGNTEQHVRLSSEGVSTSPIAPQQKTSEQISPKTNATHHARSANKVAKINLEKADQNTVDLLSSDSTKSTTAAGSPKASDSPAERNENLEPRTTDNNHNLLKSNNSQTNSLTIGGSETSSAASVSTKASPSRASKSLTNLAKQTVNSKTLGKGEEVKERAGEFLSSKGEAALPKPARSSKQYEHVTSQSEANGSQLSTEEGNKLANNNLNKSKKTVHPANSREGKEIPKAHELLSSMRSEASSRGSKSPINSASLNKDTQSKDDSSLFSTDKENQLTHNSPHFEKAAANLKSSAPPKETRSLKVSESHLKKSTKNAADPDNLRNEKAVHKAYESLSSVRAATPSKGSESPMTLTNMNLNSPPKAGGSKSRVTNTKQLAVEPVTSQRATIPSNESVSPMEASPSEMSESHLSMSENTANLSNSKNEKAIHIPHESLSFMRGAASAIGSESSMSLTNKNKNYHSKADGSKLRASNTNQRAVEPLPSERVRGGDLPVDGSLFGRSESHLNISKNANNPANTRNEKAVHEAYESLSSMRETASSKGAKSPMNIESTNKKYPSKAEGSMLRKSNGNHLPNEPLPSKRVANSSKAGILPKELSLSESHSNVSKNDTNPPNSRNEKADKKSNKSLSSMRGAATSKGSNSPMNLTNMKQNFQSKADVSKLRASNYINEKANKRQINHLSPSMRAKASSIKAGSSKTSMEHFLNPSKKKKHYQRAQTSKKGRNGNGLINSSRRQTASGNTSPSETSGPFTNNAMIASNDETTYSGEMERNDSMARFGREYVLFTFRRMSQRSAHKGIYTKFEPRANSTKCQIAPYMPSDTVERVKPFRAGNQVYVFGGKVFPGKEEKGPRSTTSRTFAFDLTTGQWTEKARLPGPSAYHEAIQLNSSSIMIAGIMLGA